MPEGNIPNEFKIRNDKYRRKRGGTSTMYVIKCAECGDNVLIYQKDGVGALVRMYLDRILWPDNLINLDRKINSTKDFSALICQRCGNIIATPMLYKKEHRYAWRIKRGSIKKKRL